jgi:hypothetical protein
VKNWCGLHSRQAGTIVGCLVALALGALGGAVVDANWMRADDREAASVMQACGFTPDSVRKLTLSSAWTQEDWKGIGMYAGLMRDLNVKFGEALTQATLADDYTTRERKADEVERRAYDWVAAAAKCGAAYGRLAK